MDGLNFFYSILISGTASSVLTELLKLPFIPVAAEKYPRITAALLSSVSAVIAVLIQGTLSVQHWAQLLATAAGTFLVAVLTFEAALRGLPTNVKDADN